MPEPHYGIDIPYDYPEVLDSDEPHAQNCQHPPARLFSWFANTVHCIGCCECGAVLAGGAE